MLERVPPREVEERFKQMVYGLIEIRLENPPQTEEKMKDRQLLEKAVALEFIDKYINPYPKTKQRYKKQRTLTEGKTPSHKTRGAVVTIFSKAWVLGAPRSAISYWINRRGRKNKYGEFKGFIYAEIPVFLLEQVQPVTVYTAKEPAIERRKKLMKWRRKHRITKRHYDFRLKHNTLIHFNDPDFKPKTQKQRSEERTRKLQKKMEDDPDYEPFDSG